MLALTNGGDVKDFPLAKLSEDGRACVLAAHVASDDPVRKATGSQS